jgi:lipopolysaccharide export system permease protein
MRLMDRYILREYLTPLAYCLGTFTMFYVIWDLFANLGEIIEAKTPALLIGRYYLCLVVPTLEFLAPASLLLATLYTLWQFTHNNELTAMRSSGVSLYRIMLPFLAIGILFSIASGVLKEAVAPAAARWAHEFSESHFTRETLREAVSDYPFANSVNHRQWRIGRVDLRDPTKLNDVSVTQERPDGSRLKRITAGHAEWLDGEWWFFDAKVQRFDSADRPIGTPERIGVRKSAGVCMPQFTEGPLDLQIASKPQEFLSGRDILHYIHTHPHISEKRMVEKVVDFHSRTAMPWACFILTLFAIPTGGRSSRQSVVAGIFLAIALLLGFYGLNVCGVFLGKRQILSPWLGAWLSNIVFLITGLLMLLRMR